jgi:hypothetical protein
MKTLAVLLSIAACAASLGAHAASAAVSPSTTRNAPEPDAKALKASVSHTTASPAPRSRIFPVNDEKGLLLTCIAPEIATNPNTDVFEDCTLAPGRTLNEVMHSFVGAMHAEEKEHEQERTNWEKAFDEKSGQTAAGK